MTAATLAIEATGLVKSYRRGLRGRYARSVAVNGLDLAVPRGSVVGLLGPNGAGKTSTIHMILGITRADAGTVRVLGGSINDPRVRARIGYVPERFELPPFLTARGFVELHAKLHGQIAANDRGREVARVLERVSLDERSDDVVSSFSKGMQQRLAIAQAILGSPQLVIFDEPTSALDPIGRRDVRDLVLELRGQGTSVLLNSHLLAEVEQVCDDVVILNRGQVVSAGSLDAQETPTSRLTATVGGWTPALQAQLHRFVTDLQAVPDRAGDVVELQGSIARDDVALVAAAVVEHGAQLLQLRTDSESLEEMFLRVVGASTEVVA